MSASLLARRALTAAGIVGLALAGACTEQSVIDPGASSKPNLIIAQATDVTWDFAALLNLGAGFHDLGTTATVSNGSNGSIALSTDAVNTHLTSKGQELPVGDTERGLGLCDVNTGCVALHDEVGDHGTGVLFMNLNGVLPAGSTLTQIALGSVQLAEGWKVSYSTTGIGGAYTLLSQGEGNGSNNAGDNVNLTAAPLPLSTTNLVLKFEKNTAASGNLSTDNDYVVKSVTTSFTSSGGCTFTLGYWLNHPDAWPVSSLTLGTVSYTKTQLLQILGTAPAGNGLIQLARQLIAAKLNVASGASPVPGAIASADALIGGKVVPPVGSGFLSPASTSTLIGQLNDFNTGVSGPGSCEQQ
jgi:hypothetical protein